MKSFLVISFLCFTFGLSHAQWVDGGRKQTQSVKGNGDLLVDGGVMYFFNEDNMMQKSTDNGMSWIDLSDSGLPPKGAGVAKNVSIMSAAGGRIYAPMNYGNGGGMVFYSTDQGDTWLMDTVGAPGQVLGWGGLPVIDDLHAWGHWLFVNWNGPNMFDIKTFGGTYTRNQYMVQGIHNPHSVTSHGDTLFVGTSVGIYYTVDGGANFITPQNAGWDGILPKLTIEGSRIYAFAHKGTSPWFMMYSDDAGNHWTTQDISAATNQKILNGDYVSPVAIHVKGNWIELSFGQNHFNQAANVWKSTDLGKTWSVDSAGLPNEYIESVTHFAYTPDGNLWAVRGHENIYRQKIDAGSGGASVSSSLRSAQPSMVWSSTNGVLILTMLQSSNAQITLVDMLGRTVRSVNDAGIPVVGAMTVRGVSAGRYWVLLRTKDGYTEVVPVLVE